MIRPTGWNICVPREFVTEHGGWTVEQEMALLKPDRWLDWHCVPNAMYDGYTPMVWSGPVPQDTVSERLQSNPGETWLLWNEPERPDQAHMTPEEALRGTHEFLSAAWASGQEFQWCAPGVSVNMRDHDGLAWATEYVKLMRRRGISRPSYWSIHLYRSFSLERMQNGWEKWLAWYDTWGAGAPVVLTEVCAEGAPLAAQVSIMEEAREMLRRGEVCGVYWFSSHPYGDWQNAALCDIVGPGVMGLTALGQAWLDLR